MKKVLLLLSVIFITASLSAADNEETPNAAVFDKALDTIEWFNGIGDDSAKKRVPPRTYREKISPPELLRTIAFFQQQNEKEKTDTAILLAQILPYFAITSEEAFGLLDEIDEKTWKSVAEADSKIVTKIKDDASVFRREKLNSAEKFVLLHEPKNAAELFKAVDVIAVVGHPVLVRHYLKRFLNDTKLKATPQEAAEIVKTVGTNNLMRMATNQDFDPFGRDAVVSLIQTAAEHWKTAGQEPDPIADTLTPPTGTKSEVRPATSVPTEEHLASQPLEVLAKMSVAKDRRLRFAALQTVMKLKPLQPYNGSSYVAETLVWFSKADGSRIVVTGHPKLSESKEIGSYFVPLGYRNVLAANCRSALSAAAQSPDIELVVIDSITPQPPVPDLVAAMQNDCRTAELPIAVLDADSDSVRRKAKALELNTDTTETNTSLFLFGSKTARMYPRLTNEKAAAWLYNDLTAKTGYVPVEPKVRVEQARQALVWLKEIVEESRQGRKIYHFDDLESTVLDALQSPIRLPEGLELAAAIKSAVMQKAIYEIAANAVNSMPVRNTAGAAFELSVNTHGVLLRGREVQAVYDRYNASEHEPKESQELLNRLIDIVEHKVLKK